jgi:tungstate transport system substrate-binding protein
METWKKMIIAAVTIVVIVIAGTLVYFQYFSKRRLMISTTTSLNDTGLLDVLEKAFEAKYPVDVNFIAVGTGIALQHAQDGDVDLTLVHSPKMENDTLVKGYVVGRKIFAYNFFTIVGPQSDPAGIEGLNATAGLKRIVQYGTSNNTIAWISRGDNSGTNSKEATLWQQAGFNYSIISGQQSWFINASQGMGETLLKAEEFSAYTLSDKGTYLAYETQNRITLTTFMTEEYALMNVYSAMAVNKTLHPSVNFNDAITFIRFLVSDEGQQLIENYGKDQYEQSLFYGAVQPIKNDLPQPYAQWIKNYAFFSGTECPVQYRDGMPTDLYG